VSKVCTDKFFRSFELRAGSFDLRVNDQPALRTQWIACPDGRTAIFRDDAVPFLRSLPEGGRIKRQTGTGKDFAEQLEKAIARSRVAMPKVIEDEPAPPLDHNLPQPVCDRRYRRI
jgi:hypothetical protein